MTARTWGSMVNRARVLSRSLGYRCAAGYLRNREVPFETAYQVIFGREPRV